MRRADAILGGGGGGTGLSTTICRRLLVTVAVVLMFTGRAIADWGYEEIDYTMAILNTTYPGSLDRPAELGKFSEGHVGPASGLLVHVQSVNSTSDHACTMPLRSAVAGEPLPPPGEPWIALIRRGHCSYEQKVENAYRSNASAVLIFNDRESPVLQKMRVSTHRDISAVFTYMWKGEALSQRVDNGTKVYMSISVGSFCSRPYSSINRTSVLFVSISFIVLMIISLTWLVFYYVQRFRYIHAKDRLARRLCSAAKKALSKIPTKNIRSEDKEMEGEGECCAICIEPYKISDVIRILPCRHEFHKPCIDPWLLEHRTCPMCKMDILKFYGYNFAGSQESILHIEIDDAGLGSSESVSTTPSPEPPEEFPPAPGQQHRASVGAITVSTSPNGQIDPQISAFNELVIHNAIVSQSHNITVDHIHSQPTSLSLDTKTEKPSKSSKGIKMLTPHEDKLVTTDVMTPTSVVETLTSDDKNCKDTSSSQENNTTCACPCACNNTALVIPSSESEPTHLLHASQDKPTSSKQRRKNSLEPS